MKKTCREVVPINEPDILSQILTVRGVQVMLDRDLAELYQVQTKALNQAEKRNRERFPGGFSFVLTRNEKMELVTNCDRFRMMKQYGGLTVRASAAFHDRFLVIDGQRLYLFGASLKDLGKKCFAFTRLDAAEIPRIVARSATEA